MGGYLTDYELDFYLERRVDDLTKVLTDYQIRSLMREVQQLRQLQGTLKKLLDIQDAN